MPYKLTRRGNTVWRAQVKVNGIKVTEQFHTKAEALAWEVDQRRQENAPATQNQPTPTVSLIEWATLYLDYSLKYRPKTYSEKKTAFKRLFKHIPPKTLVSDLKKGEVLKFLQAQFHTRSGHMANKDRKNLSAAWNDAMRFFDDFPALQNPFQAVPPFPADCGSHYVPPEADFWKVVDVSRGQDWVMLFTFLHTAARRNEVYRLKWGDIDFGGQRTRLGTRKAGGGSLVHEWIPMTGELFTILLEHRQRAVNEWVFTQSVGRHKGKPYTENRGFPQGLCQLAEVKSFGCHGIRGLTASILAKSNVPMKAIQEILRHKRLTTTERYVRGMEPVRPYLQVLEGGLKRGLPPGPTTNEKGLGLSS